MSTISRNSKKAAPRAVAAEPARAMAAEPLRNRNRSPTKADAQDERPTIKPVSPSDIQLSSVRLAAGTKSGVELPQYDGLQRFAIQLRDSWMEMPYGLDSGHLGQEPSFIAEGGTPIPV